MTLTRIFSARVLAGAVVVLLLVGFLFARGEDGVTDKTLTAHFPRAVSVYKGTDVRILGVNVGKVTSVTPEGDSVRVEIAYDGEYDLPDDARAVIVTPTLVADRFIQLTPVFTKGQKMADGADIAVQDTGVPVELDRIYASLRDLSATLGPNGINKDGTLNHLVRAGAKALNGQGERANLMIHRLSEAAATFGASSGDLFETVTQLATFTTTLGQNDRLVRAFIEDLAGVSRQLAGERQELQGVLSSVSDAVGVVEGFVKHNRQALVTDVEKLTRVVHTINSERDNIDTALKVAPVAMGNLFLAYNTESGSIGSRIGVSGNLFDADGFLCSVVQQSSMPKITKDLACQIFKALLVPAEEQLPTIPPAPAQRPAAPGQPGPATTNRPPTSPGIQGPNTGPTPSLEQLFGGAP